MPYLDGRGHEEDVDLAASDCVDSLPQWGRVFRQAPIIDADGEHLSATFCQSRKQFGTRNSVLLDRYRTPPEWEQIAFFIQEMEKFAPCIWFGNDRSDGHAQLAEGGHGFRASCNHRSPAKSGNELLARTNAFCSLRQCTCAYAGQENDKIESSVSQRRNEFQGIAVVLGGNFACGRSHYRLTSIVGDEQAHLAGSAAFERQHAQPAESRRRIQIFCHCQSD